MVTLPLTGTLRIEEDILGCGCKQARLKAAAEAKAAEQAAKEAEQAKPEQQS
jgi:hypothetical protein